MKSFKTKSKKEETESFIPDSTRFLASRPPKAPGRTPVAHFLNNQGKVGAAGSIAGSSDSGFSRRSSINSGMVGSRLSGKDDDSLDSGFSNSSRPSSKSLFPSNTRSSDLGSTLEGDELVRFASVALLSADNSIGDDAFRRLQREKNGLHGNGYREKCFVDYFRVTDENFFGVTHAGVFGPAPLKYVVVVQAEDLVIPDRYERRLGKYLSVLSLRAPVGVRVRVTPVVVGSATVTSVSALHEGRVPANVIVETLTPLQHVNPQNFLVDACDVPQSLLEDFAMGGLSHWRSKFGEWADDLPLENPHIFSAPHYSNSFLDTVILFHPHQMLKFLLRPLAEDKLEPFYLELFHSREATEMAMNLAKRGLITEEALFHFFCTELGMRSSDDDSTKTFEVVMNHIVDKGIVYPVPEPAELYYAVKRWFFDPFLIRRRSNPIEAIPLHISSCDKKIGVEIRIPDIHRVPDDVFSLISTVLHEHCNGRIEVDSHSASGKCGKVSVLLQNGAVNASNPFQLRHFAGTTFLVFVSGGDVGLVWIMVMAIVDSIKMILSEGWPGLTYQFVLSCPSVLQGCQTSTSISDHGLLHSSIVTQSQPYFCLNCQRDIDPELMSPVSNHTLDRFSRSLEGYENETGLDGYFVKKSKSKRTWQCITRCFKPCEKEAEENNENNNEENSHESKEKARLTRNMQPQLRSSVNYERRRTEEDSDDGSSLDSSVHEAGEVYPRISQISDVALNGRAAPQVMAESSLPSQIDYLKAPTNDGARNQNEYHYDFPPSSNVTPTDRFANQPVRNHASPSNMGTFAFSPHEDHGHRSMANWRETQLAIKHLANKSYPCLCTKTQLMNGQEIVKPRATAILLRYNPHSGFGIVLTNFHVYDRVYPDELYATFTFYEKEDLTPASLSHYLVPFNGHIPGVHSPVDGTDHIFMEMRPTSEQFDPDLHPVGHLIPRTFHPSFWVENDRLILVGYPFSNPKLWEIVQTQMEITGAVALEVVKDAKYYLDNGLGGVVSAAHEFLTFRRPNPNNEVVLRAADIVAHPMLLPLELQILLDRRRINLKCLSRWGASGGPLLTTKQRGSRCEALVAFYAGGFPHAATRGQDFVLEHGVKMQYVQVERIAGGQPERLF